MGLAAEHGCFYRHPAALTSAPLSGDRRVPSGWIGLADDVDLGWRDAVLPLFRYYTERTPGSFIEEKDINLTWHYRNADPEFGAWQASELQMNLGKILAHLPITVRAGRHPAAAGVRGWGGEEGNSPHGLPDRGARSVRAWRRSRTGGLGRQDARGASHGD